jgi:site-specific recombinase XerD
MNEFFKTIRAFLTEYLPKQRCFSENTVRSYRQALNLLVTFLRAERGLSTEKITFEIFDKTLVVDFLGWLETVRNCSAASRNQRLMALRSFFAYAGNCDAMWMSLRLEVAAVPRKNEPGRIVGFLTEDALKALLGVPDPKKRVDLRNLTFMILMYDTAARCGELLSMKLSDLRFDTRHPIAYLHGKGNKTRTVPLLPRTVEHSRNNTEQIHAGHAGQALVMVCLTWFFKHIPIRAYQFVHITFLQQILPTSRHRRRVCSLGVVHAAFLFWEYKHRGKLFRAFRSCNRKLTSHEIRPGIA